MKGLLFFTIVLSSFSVLGQQIVRSEKAANRLIEKKSIVIKSNVQNCVNQLFEYVYYCKNYNKKAEIVFVFPSCNEVELQFLKSYFRNLDKPSLDKCHIVINSNIFNQFTSIKYNSVFVRSRSKYKFLLGGVEQNFEIPQPTNFLLKDIYSSSYPDVKQLNDRIGILSTSIGLLYLGTKDNNHFDSFYVSYHASEHLDEFYRTTIKDSVKLKKILELRKIIYSDTQRFFQGESEVQFESFNFVNDSLICLTGVFNAFVMPHDTCRMKKWNIYAFFNINTGKLAVMPMKFSQNLSMYYLSQSTIYKKGIDSFEINYSVFPIDPSILVEFDSLPFTSVKLEFKSGKFIAEPVIEPNSIYITNMEWLNLTKEYMWRVRTIRINDSVYVFENQPKFYMNKYGNSPNFIQPKEGDQVNSFFLYNFQRQNNFYYFFIRYVNRCVVYKSANLIDYTEIAETSSDILPMNMESDGKILTYQVEGSKVYFNYILSK
ncbi:MAG: hypothetical protein IT244_10530 [Bacteroidia bacterium]|nr:hypothetical protein [Bacteroidia bacterium]